LRYYIGDPKTSDSQISSVPGFYSRRNANLSCHPSQTRLFQIIYRFDRSFNYLFTTIGSKGAFLLQFSCPLIRFRTWNCNKN